MNKKMMALFSGMFILGILFIGNGITGLYLFEVPGQPCNEDSDCADIDVCCYFYNEGFGVCGQEDNCDAVEKATFDGRQSFSTYDELEAKQPGTPTTLSSHAEGPSKPKSIYSALVGIVLVLFAVFGYFVGKIRDIHEGRSRSLYRHHEK